MDGQKPIHQFPILVYTEAVSTMMSYVMLLNEKLWHFFYKKRPKKIMVTPFMDGNLCRNSLVLLCKKNPPETTEAMIIRVQKEDRKME